jgi:hypothetical protein
LRKNWHNSGPALQEPEKRSGRLNRQSCFSVYRRAAGDDFSMGRYLWPGGKQLLSDGAKIMARPTAIASQHGLWDSLRTLLQAWWGSDRIRTSPTTGRILALRPGDRFLLMDQIWIVTFRDVKCRDSSARLRLGISSETRNQTAELNLRASGVDAKRTEPAVLQIDDQIVPVWDAEISILPPKSFAADTTD